ncbi:MAG: LysR family transcriptional regulator [Deltaproteobacteria bacterium]|nr:LysR family transcriptional regulator [Deltaproteobacteria bacterium]
MIERISGNFLQWLRSFYYVAENGSIRQAAIAMGRKQPTITRQIQLLEKELGVTLFDRSRSGAMITAEGKKLQEELGHLFRDVNRIKADLKVKDRGYEGKISVATPHAIIDAILLPYVEQFRKLHPRVMFHFEGAIHEEVYEKVESAEVDFGISVCETAPETLTCYTIFETGLVLIAPKKNPFFRGKSPTLRQIAKAPLIFFTHGCSVDPLIAGPFAEEHLRPNVVMTHNNFMSMKKYVAIGMGAAILGRHAVSKEDEKVFDIFSLDRYFPMRRHGIVLKKNAYISPLLRAFLKTIKPDIKFIRRSRQHDPLAL